MMKYMHSNLFGAIDVDYFLYRSSVRYFDLGQNQNAILCSTEIVLTNAALGLL